jgi:hypothetical protein
MPSALIFKPAIKQLRSVELMLIGKMELQKNALGT